MSNAVESLNVGAAIGASPGGTNIYGRLIIMALICADIVKLLFVGRRRLMGWQEAFT
jgi:NitT/TauT family transport system permease protein